MITRNPSSRLPGVAPRTLSQIATQSVAGRTSIMTPSTLIWTGENTTPRLSHHRPSGTSRAARTRNDAASTTAARTR